MKPPRDHLRDDPHKLIQEYLEFLKELEEKIGEHRQAIERVVEGALDDDYLKAMFLRSTGKTLCEELYESIIDSMVFVNRARDLLKNK